MSAKNITTGMSLQNNHNPHFLKIVVDNSKCVCYCLSKVNHLNETVEAEITAMMPLQRACDAESQVRNKLSNGPLRAQSNENIRVFCDVSAYVSCQGYVGILLSARVMP